MMSAKRNLTSDRLINEWAARVVYQYEHLMQCKTDVPIPVLDIAERVFNLHCDVEKFKGKLTNASGILLPEKRWVLINGNKSEKHQLFTLAHELGHWIIDFSGYDILEHGLEAPIGVREKTTSAKEKVANRFAAALLIPEHILLDQILGKKVLQRSDVVHLSHLFNVSLITMELRLDSLSYSLEEVGISFGRSKYNNISSSYRVLNDFSAKTHSPIKAISIDYDVIDHNLVRKLKKIKETTGKLYLLVPDDRIDDADVIQSFNSIDGVVLYNDKEKVLLELFGYMDEQASPSFCNLRVGSRIGKLFYREQDRFQAKSPNQKTTIYAREGQLNYKQKESFDFKKYIVSPVKLKYRKDAKEFVASAKLEKKRVVIATGCFDLITNAHIKFLRAAKALGDILVVGIEDDNRVKAFKGSLRPVNIISQRVEVVDALEFVDFVFVISGSPKFEIKPFYTRLHKEIRADILAVTETDPHLSDRRDEIEAGGGVLQVIHHIESNSTTSLLRQLLAKTEYSDLVIVSKEKIEEINKKDNWRQLKLFPD